MKIEFVFLRIFCILFFFSSFSEAETLCPKCGFKNEDSDRYCLNCQFELRPLSESEVRSFNVLNLQRSEKAKDSREQEAQSQKVRNRELKEQNSTPLPPVTESFDRIPLFIDGKVIRMGMTKQKIRNMLDLHKKYDKDIWNVSSGNGFQDSTLYFSDNVLVKWEKSVFYDYYIQRNYPLDPGKLKTGMSEQEVKSLWGAPDCKYEVCSSSYYQEKVSYYIKEPHSETRYLPVRGRNESETSKTVVIKEGLMAEIIFDAEKKILNYTVKEGETRQGRNLEGESDF